MSTRRSLPSVALGGTILLAAFLLGLFAGKTPAFDFNERLTSGDIVNALTTLIVVVVLGIVFQKAFSENRVEKDLLIAQIREAVAAMKAVRDLFFQAHTTQTSDELDRAILVALRGVSVQLTTLERACAEGRTDYRAPALTDARRYFREYRALLADRALTPDSRYDDETYSRAEAAYGRFSHALLMFSMHVNKR